jgi:hypothetical protein
MTSLKLYVNRKQQIGPLEVWPIKLSNMSLHNYNVPPFGDRLVFSEHDDGDGPRVNLIEVSNPTDEDFIIPSGWVVGANLLQVRMFNFAEHVAAGESILASVVCVEKGRWEVQKNETDGGRAPLSVMSAGWEFNPEARSWRMDMETRQSKVWKQVERQEMRGGTRSTNSLQQIMREDANSFGIQRFINRASRTNLKTYDGQNGVLIGLDGEPLMMEFFSNSLVFNPILEETIRAISFDLSHLDFSPMADRDVRRFVEDAGLANLTPLSSGDWALPMVGGVSGIDTQAAADRWGRLLHSLSINRRHRMLQVV